MRRGIALVAVFAAFFGAVAATIGWCFEQSPRHCVGIGLAIFCTVLVGALGVGLPVR